MHNIILWFGLAIIPVVWFLQNVVHESSHALIPLFKGCKVKIYPWPKFENGRWYMAFSTWQCQTLLPQKLRLVISAAPRIVDLLIIAVTVAVQPANAWANTILQAWQIAALMDFSFNTVGIFYGPERRNDAWTCAELAEIKNISMLRVLSVAAVLISALPVAYRLFF